jgi:hypothetical protein
MILFLDFDGVMHPDAAEQDQHFRCASRIEEVLRDFPAVQVVISSSWREAYTLEQIRGFFSPDIAARIHDVTPVLVAAEMLPEALCSFMREGECLTWMKLHRPEGTPWIALDDQAWRFQPMCPNLLLTDPKTGFTDENAQTLRQHLEAFARHMGLLPNRSR